MITLIEMKQKSLMFRRLSSNLLRSSREDADVNLARFAKCIEDDSFIHDLIHSRIDNVDYDFMRCFQFKKSGWAQNSIPVNENDHLKAQYDFLQYILNQSSVLGLAMRYPYQRGEKYDDIIRNFLNTSFKPMIDFIVDSMSEEMINLEGCKTTQGSMTIQTVNGNAIMQTGAGTINATTNVSTQAADLVSIINRLLPELDNLKDVPQEEIESVKDDLESLREQALAEVPKPSRMKKALAGIQKFGRDVLVKLMVSLTSNAILKTDWLALEQQATAFISGFLQ